jgi:hypothetical protein
MKIRKGERVVSTTTAKGVTADAEVYAPHVRSWHVDVDVFEMGDHTAAHAVLRAEAARNLDASGEARRNPADVEVPEIGDEIAVARAVRHLSDRLFEAASSDIAGIEGHDVTVSR